MLVQPAESVGEGALAALAALSVVAEACDAPTDARLASSWAELIALARAPVDDGSDGQVLFLAHDARAMLETAGELVRLGCDRVDLRQVGASFLLRVAAPPYYTYARALDGSAGLTAFLPQPRGQDRVYVQAGYAHPLANLLRPAPGLTLLVSPDKPWLPLANEAWTDLYSIVELVVRGEARAFEPSLEPARLRVPLRLARGAYGEPPALWVLRSDASVQVERLLASIPEEVATGLLFAVTTGDPPTVVVRVRPSARTPVTIDLEGETYRAHGQVPNLFLPLGLSLEPPLRQSRLRELFTPDPDQLTWIAGDGADLRVERIDEHAFRPLTEWVDYVTDGAVVQLTAWLGSATFDFERFEVAERPPEEPRDPPPAAAPRVASSGRPRKRTPEPALPAAAAPPATAKPVPKVVADTTADVAPEDGLLVELAAREREFLELQGPADDPARTALWAAMADLSSRVGRTKDAALCWTRALWDAPSADARALVDAWSSAEIARAADREALLASTRPTRDTVSAVAAVLARDAFGTASTPRLDPALASVWLDRFDEVLDVRSLWLARSAVALLTGGDPLALARARDRVLSRLHRGLSVEHDVPTFLRFLGGTRDSNQIERLGACLHALARRYETTKRTMSTVEADPKLTLAYVRFVIGYGSARIGQIEQARAYGAAASKLLDLGEPIHGFLARAYLARIEQAIEGLPLETPLPPELAGSLNALDKFSRYKVDRVRQFSTVLEPHERLDPVVAFQRGEEDPRGPEFTLLRGMSNVAALEDALDSIFAKARTSDPDVRARLFDGMMDFFPAISVERALRYLEEIVASLAGVPPARQAQLLEEALMIAGHVGDRDLARRIFEPLRLLVSGLGADGAAEIAPMTGGMLRTLRRFGLREEASALLIALQTAASGATTSALLARLHGAAALAYLGELERAEPVFAEALGVLGGTLPMAARLDLTRALARAVAPAPLPYALGVLDKLGDKLATVTDSFNTNSHVCVSALGFVEAIVLGYASDDLTLGELRRQWLDDDEYLVRRRIHRDMGHT